MRICIVLVGISRGIHGHGKIFDAIARGEMGGRRKCEDSLRSLGRYIGKQIYVVDIIIFSHILRVPTLAPFRVTSLRCFTQPVQYNIKCHSYRRNRAPPRATEYASGYEKRKSTRQI